MNKNHYMTEVIFRQNLAWLILTTTEAELVKRYVNWALLVMRACNRYYIRI